jgi:hypothetical protein
MRAARSWSGSVPQAGEQGGFADVLLGDGRTGAIKKVTK